jgi:2-keto-4-pentenoate hydratase/2-oxohepta-3-ene-1,7-dioic acid hydratase in catechol pathway
MKFVTFRNASASRTTDRLGVLTEAGRHVVGLSRSFSNMLALIDAGEAGLAAARAALQNADEKVPLEGVQLLAPLPEPRQMRDAMTFELHYKQSMKHMARLRVGQALGKLADAAGVLRLPKVWYEQPTYYKCNRFAVIGPEADVIWPQGAELLDYECEIAAVIGKTGKDIPRERAIEHIFGYCIFNDMTARDLQEREMRALLGPAKSKDFDTANILGPYIVTRDELSDPYSLDTECRVNGEVWGRGSTRDMHHRWDAVIAHISRNETLYAGEVIGSGTVGNGCGLEQGRFLRPGSLIELEVTGLGTLRNRLVKP